jgi:predicted DNA-binding protein
VATKTERWSVGFRIRVSPEQYERVKRLAFEKQTTVSQVAREALVRRLNEEAGKR